MPLRHSGVTAGAAIAHIESYSKCRTPEEYAQGSVAGSVNIPIKLSDGKGGFTPNPQFDEQVGICCEPG